MSLVELLIFIVVVGAALAATLTALTQATATSADPLLRRQALAVAESLLEEIELMPFTFCDGDDANVETAASTAGFGAHGVGPALAMAILSVHPPVNLVRVLADDVGGGFAVVGALQGGSTPYYTSYVNGLVKLTYNASYRFREVYE